MIGAEDNGRFRHAHGGGVHGDAGRGGGFGPLLRNIDESLVDHLGDRQAAFRVDAREVGLAGEARRHAHGRERLAERELRFGAELRQAHLHLPIGKVVEPAGQVSRCQRFLEVRKAGAGRRQQDVEGHPGAGVAHFQDLGGRRCGVAKIRGLVHEVGLGGGAGRQGERRGLRVRGDKRVLPLAIEVDSAGEDHAGLGVERSGREQVLDLLFGVLFGPAVDLRSRGLGIRDEIERRRWSLVVVGERVLEGRLDGQSFLHPESVRGVQFVASGVAGLGEVGEQRSEGGIVGGVVMDVQDGLDFLGGLAAGARTRHGERRGDVEGRENQVPVASHKLFVGGSGEGVHRRRYTGVGGRQRGGQQDRQNKTFHGGSGYTSQVTPLARRGSSGSRHVGLAHAPAGPRTTPARLASRSPCRHSQGARPRRPSHRTTAARRQPGS